MQLLSPYMFRQMHALAPPLVSSPGNAACCSDGFVLKGEAGETLLDEQGAPLPAVQLSPELYEAYRKAGSTPKAAKLAQQAAKLAGCSEAVVVKVHALLSVSASERGACMSSQQGSSWVPWMGWHAGSSRGPIRHAGNSRGPHC